MRMHRLVPAGDVGVELGQARHEELAPGIDGGRARW